MRLEVKGVSKSFSQGGGKAKNSVQALDDVSFELGANEILGFVGANGAGKSTCMRIIMGVLDADEGQILLDDLPATQQARQRIGYMPSERGLYPKMKVFEQLVYLARLKGLSKDEAEFETDKWMNLLDIGEHKEKQLQTLSTGNAQRVQLVAALAPKPKMLILDEPFAGLDPIAVRVMGDAFRQAKASGIGIMFSSHQLELIDQLCDRVAIIQAGEIVHIGTPDQLRKAAGAKPTITIPTPLNDIFGELIK